MILAAASLIAAGVLGILRLSSSPAAPPAPLRRFEISPEEILVTEASAPSLSPDGQRILYRAQERLWVRRLDQIDATTLPGTEGADHAVWSPRSDEIAFMTGSELWRMAIPGGERAAISWRVNPACGWMRIPASTSRPMAADSSWCGLSRPKAPARASF